MMKIDEVPQDKGYLIEGRISDLNYVVDRNGQYTSKKSKGWKPKNEATSMAWDMVFERVERARQQILSGVLSPLAFYMELNIMDVGILASYIGISRWRVRKHLKMKNFVRLSPGLLEKYAEALQLTSAELVDVQKIRETKLKHDD
jgi:hypothetical protein